MAFRLGRLAIDLSMQGQGLGGDMLLAAGERALAVAAEVGGVALAIDAKDETAARWYQRFGALPLLDDPLKLILPLSVIADAIGTAGRQRQGLRSVIRSSTPTKAKSSGRSRQRSSASKLRPWVRMESQTFCMANAADLKG